MAGFDIGFETGTFAAGAFAAGGRLIGFEVDGFTDFAAGLEALAFVAFAAGFSFVALLPEALFAPLRFGVAADFFLAGFA